MTRCEEQGSAPALGDERHARPKSVPAASLWPRGTSGERRAQRITIAIEYDVSPCVGERDRDARIHDRERARLRSGTEREKTDIGLRVIPNVRGESLSR